MDKKQYERVVEIHEQLENLNCIRKIVGAMSPVGMRILDDINKRDVSFYNTDEEFRHNVKETIYEMVEREIKRLEDEISNM